MSELVEVRGAMRDSTAAAADEWERFERVVRESLTVRQPHDLSTWLRGELQSFVPHDIMIAAWGNFSHGDICWDVLPLPAGEVRQFSGAALVSCLHRLHARWTANGRMPLALNYPEGCITRSVDGVVPQALHAMRSALVHGINDERSHHDCLYVALHAAPEVPTRSRRMLDMLLPYIDNALRRVSPAHGQDAEETMRSASEPAPSISLSARELEILEWVRQGKTNQEIGMILGISAYTVKNHLQRIFRKLDVFNRVQAVSKFARAAGPHMGSYSHG